MLGFRLFSVSVSPGLMLGYALSLLNTRPLRVSIGSSSILFPRQLFIPMHNGCCIRHHRGHILARGCPALSLPCLCPEPLSSPTNRSVEELAVTDTWSSAMATACLLTGTQRRNPHDGSGLAKVRPSCVVIRLSYHLCFLVQFGVLVQLFSLSSSL